MPADNTPTDACAVFIAKKMEIDELLKEIAASSEDHFGVDPEKVNWGHVGDMQAAIDLLRRARSWAVK